MRIARKRPKNLLIKEVFTPQNKNSRPAFYLISLTARIKVRRARCIDKP